MTSPTDTPLLTAADAATLVAALDGVAKAFPSLADRFNPTPTMLALRAIASGAAVVTPAPAEGVDEGLLTDVKVTLSHGRTFITSREKMHPDGVKLWDELLAKVEAALSRPPEPTAEVRVLAIVREMRSCKEPDSETMAYFADEIEAAMQQEQK